MLVCCAQHFLFSFFFQAEDGIRDLYVTGVQTCALPIYPPRWLPGTGEPPRGVSAAWLSMAKIGRASCRERVEISVGAVSLKKKKKKKKKKCKEKKKKKEKKKNLKIKKKMR